MKSSILIIDDELNSLKVLSLALKKEGFSVEACSTGEEALAKLDKDVFDLVISDYKLPGINGEVILERVKEKTPSVPFILLTAYGSIERAVNAMKKGAYTYLTKPVHLSLLSSVAREALGERIKDYVGDPCRYQFLNIVGKSKPMQDVFSMIQRVSKTDAGVLILGETGTGKELAARAIHYSSMRANSAFIPIDCTTIPKDLMESELFGHEKGAFTCAYASKTGLLEMANEGTVFFDEIGDLDFTLQKKLLRFLQEKEFYKIGGKQKIKVDVRVIAATNRNIEKAVEQGEFRADLYYRFNVITINMPPLRERSDDIPLIAAHFLEFFTKKYKKDITGFEPAAMDALKHYDWPGNVRELENVIERATILCPSGQINISCLPYKLKPLLPEENYSLEDGLNLAEMEKRVVLKALEASSWNQSKSALLLGITRKQLRTKMKNLGLLPG
ncbi:MAG: sigma-54-dependent Fis family transcriptional regulator [Nitrospirae bacterium]|nr:MAG: sigma-54-dependent Fis family transcriptional regulator [Nitrospirota bacterium]